MAFVFRREGPIEEGGAVEELVEAPEAMDMLAVLWHEERCIGAEDFVGTADDFGGVGDFEGAGAA